MPQGVYTNWYKIEQIKIMTIITIISKKGKNIGKCYFRGKKYPVIS